MSFAEIVAHCTLIFYFVYYMAIVVALLGSAITVGLMYRVMCWSGSPLFRHVALGCASLVWPVLYWVVLVPCMILCRLTMFPFRNLFGRE